VIKYRRLPCRQFEAPLGSVSLAPDRVNERPVARHIPYSDARPLPIRSLYGPLEGVAAEWTRAGQIESPRERLPAVAPHDLPERERKGPLDAGGRGNRRG